MSWILLKDGSFTVQGQMTKVSPVRLQGVGLPVFMDTQALEDIPDAVWTFPLLLLTTCQSPFLSLDRGAVGSVGSNKTELDSFALLVLVAGLAEV